MPPRQLRLIKVQKRCTAEELLKELHLNPLVYFVIRDKRALLPDEVLLEGQVVGVLPVIAGGYEEEAKSNSDVRASETQLGQNRCACASVTLAGTKS